MNPQADQSSRTDSNLPLFQAIGWLTGQLAADEKGRYRLTSDGESFPVRILGRMNKLVRGKAEFLGVIRSWTVYPRTNPRGELISVQLIRLGAPETRRVDEFHISGCVVPPRADGLIGVKIKPNLSGVQPQKPLKLALPGESFVYPVLPQSPWLSAGESGGELWRFDCQRQGLHLEMMDGVKVKGRYDQSKQRTMRKGAGQAAPQSQSLDSFA